MADTRTEKFTKSCDCGGATASGPRIIGPKYETVLGAHVSFSGFMVRFACDTCDMEWNREVVTDG